MKENTDDDIRAQAIAIGEELGAKLAALGVPFMCLVGLPSAMTNGETLRLSNGLEMPEVNHKMRLEAERYALHMEWKRFDGGKK
jgi:hypothetical protein